MSFFYYTEDRNNDDELYKYISSTLQNLYKQLNLQKNKKHNLIIWINKIADICIDDYKNTDTYTLLSNVEELKDNLDNIRINIEEINKLISYLKDIILSIENSSNDKSSADISVYYTLYMETQNIILERDLKIENLLGKLYNYSIFNFSDTTNSTETINTNFSNSTPMIDTNNIPIEKQIETSQNILPIQNRKSEKNTIQNPNIISNVEQITDNDTLIISETQGKVFLPYKISDLELIIKENPTKYNCLEDLIHKEYILPLSKYKNSSLARFRETFALMKEREKASFAKALDLALELTFKYNLNPAVISACKNLDELDVYLDCLDDTNLDEFKIFNIKYEIPPIKV